MKKYVGIQYLRAVAAIGVVVFHAAHRARQGFPVGALGVDIFFVISGFIMWTVAGRKRHGAGAFLLDRVRRIAPTYWIATIAMVGGAAVGLFPRLKLTATHLVASLAFIPGVSPANGRMWPVLVQGWTLNLEMLFYLIFACLLALGRTPRLIALCATLAGLVALGTVAPADWLVLRFYGSPLLLEFAAGAIIGEALLRDRMPSASVGTALTLAGFAGFAAIHLGALPFGVPAAAGSAIALVLGVTALDHDGRVPHWPGLGFLGDASYSIYLWHTFGIGLVLRLVGRDAIPPLALAVLATTTGVALGAILYVWLERPLTRSLARRRPGLEHRAQAGKNETSLQGDRAA